MILDLMCYFMDLMVSYYGCLCLLKAHGGSENGVSFLHGRDKTWLFGTLVYNEKLGFNECLKDVEVCEHRA